ncbi:MAG: hypothetical protein VB858_05870 [Planctomycetaceae bacterium]
MSNQPSELARLQAALLDHLDQAGTDGSPLDLQDLKTSPEYRAWLDVFDPHMAHMAGCLVRKWGRRREEQHTISRPR